MAACRLPARRHGRGRLPGWLASAVAALAMGASGGTAWALDPERRITSYNVRVWTEAHGLPQDTVRAIAQTPDGFLWVGTQGGLARFDGVKFATMEDQPGGDTLTREVRSLTVGNDGALWVGVRHPPGLFRHDPGRGFAAIPRRTLDLPVSRAVIASFVDAQQRLWVGSWRGAAVLDGGRAQVFAPEHGLPPGDVWAITQTPDGAVWLGTGQGLARWRGERLETIALPPSSAPAIRALLPDGPDGLWIGTDSGLLSMQQGRFRRFGRSEGLPHDQINALLRDRDGGLWVATDGGLARQRGQGWEVLAGRKDVPADGVRSLHEDREGNLWLGMRSTGLLRLTGGSLGHLTSADGLVSDRTTSISVGRDGALWIGTSGDGLVRFHQGRARVFTARDGLCASWVLSVLEDSRGRVWAAGLGGAGVNVCVLDSKEEGARWRTFSGEAGIPPGQVVRALYEDRAGRIWIGSQGLFQVVDDHFVAEPPPPKISGFHNVYRIFEDSQGTLWVGTGVRLLLRPPGGPWTAAAGNGPEDVPRAPVVAFHQDGRGDLWMATAGGLVRHRAGRYLLIGRRAGLTEDPLFSVLEDAQGDLWASSARGLLRVDPAEVEAFARGQVPAIRPSRYGAADGMGTNRAEGAEGGSTAARDQQGVLWFPTRQGLVSVFSRGQGLPPPSPVRIEALLVDGRPLALTGTVEIPPGQRDVRFAFTVPALTAPERVRFRYRLAPLDHTWVDAGADRVASYTRVPPGRYRFSVMATNGEGGWSEMPASLDLHVLPRASETLAFRIALVLAAALALLALYRWRLARVRAQHALVLTERNRIARDIHDTLAQGFTGISLELEAASKRLTTAPEKARTSLDKARVLVRMSLADARRAVWDLREQREEGDDVLGALQRLGRDLAGGTPIRVEVVGSVRPLAPEAEKAMVRVAQEAVTNAVKHAQASSIVVQVTYGPDLVELCVRDDGRGFDPGQDHAERGHFGLLGMRERVEDLGGEVRVQSRPGAGTQVSMRLPTAAPSRSRGS